MTEGNKIAIFIIAESALLYRAGSADALDDIGKQKADSQSST